MHSPQYGAALIGLVVGAILYGATLMQTNTYFHKYRSDPLWMKLCVAAICILDTLHLCFSVHMMYFYLVDNFGNIAAVMDIVWSLKGLGTVQVLLIWLVHFLYLSRIWKLSRKIVTNTKVSSALLAGIVITVSLALAVGIMFIIKLQDLKQGLSMAGFRWAIFFALSVTIVIDSLIAGVMSFLLYRSQTGMKRTDSMLFTLMQYIVGTGLLTSAASVIYMILYVVKPDTLFYLAQEFSVTRLYANSFLAMMNARHRLRGQMNQPVDIEINLATALRFATPSPSMDEARKQYHSPPETHLPHARSSSTVNIDIIPPPPCLGDEDVRSVGRHLYNNRSDVTAVERVL